ncbi:MAG: Amino-acid carrier protein AlsT [Chlamydiae bacterium]|nr:Amino-acid carrier protein AlsT [Chlamydiota bacterium]
MTTILELFNHYLTLYIVFPMLFALGLYFSTRLKFIQFSKIKLGIKELLKKSDPQEEGTISNFEALSAVLAGNLGTGNISGMAVALATGGPGSLIWMWLMASLGAIIKFAGCFLSLKYREKNSSGEYVGGPMYYLSKGLELKKVATLFSIFAIIAAFTVGNLVQVNSIMLPLAKMGVSPILVIAFLVVGVGAVLLGGIQRLARVVSTMVPVMTCVYLLTALIILFIFREHVLGAFALILKSSVSFNSVAGGVVGLGLSRAISTGMERGIFATDAGCGIAPILQAGARCKNPFLEGVVGMIAPFIVMIICTITALVLIVTGAWQTSGEFSTNMCTWAFETGLGHVIGKYIVIVSLALFAFTTIITWAYCGEKACEYLFSHRAIKKFKYIYILMLPLGVFSYTHTVWILADVSIALMVVMNLIGLVGHSSKVIEETKKHLTLS